MWNRSQVPHIAGALLWYTFFWYLLVAYPFSFNYETTRHDQYYFLPYACAAVLVWGMMQLLRNLSVPIVIMLCLITVSAALFLFPGPYNSGNEHFSILCCIACISIMLLTGTKHMLIIIWAGICCCWMYELYAGIHQYIVQYGQYTINNITGTLQNSGVYSWYMVLHLPMIWYFLRSVFFRQRTIKWPVILFSGVAVLMVTIVFINQSRTAILALLIMALFALAPQFRKLWSGPRGRMITGGIVALIISGAWLLVQFKLLSAMGRVLMLDVVSDQAGKFIWTGTGAGRFTWYYPQWQAAYFQSHAHPPLHYYLSAGETYLLFNEYVQLILEMGLPGLLVLLLLMTWFFRAKTTETPVSRVLQITMAGILACGLTSYPFHTGPVLMLFMLCLASMFVISTKQYRNVRAYFVLPVVLPVFALVLYRSVPAALACRQWYHLQEHDATAGYAPLMPQLCTDGKFLTEYGESILKDSCLSAASILEESRLHFISFRNTEAAAQARTCTGDYATAMTYYRFLSNYVPSRFAPQYRIVHLYLLMHDTTNARNTASDILTMPVKRPSAELDLIKREMKLLLHNTSSHE